MQVAGLFSGIGGFELAFSEAGFSSLLLAEIDEAASAVLRRRFPDCALHTDVAEVRELPTGVEVVTAGFPCQNLSMAGDKSGIEGAKSGVVDKMFELISRSNVPTVVIENVYFMLHLDRGNAMRRLADQFESLRYKWAYRVLDTMAFGLPQRRRRVYLVASRVDDPRSVLFADEAEASPQIKPSLEFPIGFYWTEGRSGVGFTTDGIPPLKVGSGWGIPSAPAVLFPDGEVLMPSLESCELLQGFPSGWTAVEERTSKKRPEWRLIGNAVSVPVARWVADRVKRPGTVGDFATKALGDAARWPDAAWNVGDGRTAVHASDHPVQRLRPSISAFRDKHWTRLSDRALNGFISRAVEGGLRMPVGFLDALQNASRKTDRAA